MPQQCSPRFPGLMWHALAVVALAFAALLTGAPARAAAPLSAPWRDTGLTAASGEATCFDATTPGLLYSRERSGTFAVNWLTGQRTQIQARMFDACNEQTGALYALNPDGATALRFSVADPQGRTIDHFPNFPALDGTVLYSFGSTLQHYASDRFSSVSTTAPAAPGHLFVSEDGGLTWAERGQSLGGPIDDIALTGDARALYALVRQVQPDKSVVYTLSFSADAGVTWEQRSEVTDQDTGDGSRYHALLRHNLEPGAFTRALPATTVLMETGLDFGGPHGATDVLLSTDGGRTFAKAGTIEEGLQWVVLASTSAGLLRMADNEGRYTADLTTDGATYQPISLPLPLQSAQLFVTATMPNDVFLRGDTSTAFSSDGGRTWQPLFSGFTNFTISPTSPPTLAMVDYPTMHLWVLDLATAGSPGSAATPAVPAPTTAGACAPVAPNSAFAVPAFQTQWQQGEALVPNFWGATVSGGLQEPFAGSQRLVQYFDKGRMELAVPTTGLVTNGLLANELITGQVQVGAADFQPRPAAAIPIAGDPDNPGPTYAELGTNAASLLTATPDRTGTPVSASMSTTGAVTVATATASAPTTLAVYDTLTQHNVAAAFATYRDQLGLAAIGYAKSEPFVTSVKVGGVQKQVVVQVFERRVLTYTADNPDPYKVEMGNIGQHYYRWRYCTP